VIDYGAQDFTHVVSGCDAVFDTVGGDVALRSFAVLRTGGRAAFIASGSRAPASPRPDVRSLRPDVRRDRPHLERVAALVETGAVHVPEIRTYPLSEAAQAHRVSEGRHFRGKLALTLALLVVCCGSAGRSRVAFVDPSWGRSSFGLDDGTPGVPYQGARARSPRTAGPEPPVQNAMRHGQSPWRA
jgi:hypothetical protein